MPPNHGPYDQNAPRPARQLLLLLFTAAVSFALGMVVGRSSAPVQQVVRVTMPAPLPPATANKDLTFYKTLPKGERATLGSGINHGTAASPPPQNDRPATAALATSPPPPSSETAERPPSAEAAPDATKEKTEPRPERSGAWILQASSSPRETDAQALAKRLRAKGYKTNVEPVVIKGKTWFRVYVGPYATPAGARDAAKKLARQEKLAPIARKM